MSYAYDVMRSVFENQIRPKLEDDELAYRFANLIEDMHEANHQLNDGINKNNAVSHSARKLEQHVAKGDTKS